MPFSRIVILSFAALITMVNPLAAIPSFIALTEGASRQLRAKIALTAGLAMTVVLSLFLVAGNFVFKFFGITVPAFQIMGGTIFFINALRTLMADERRLFNTGGDQRAEDQLAAANHPPLLDPASLAIVPIAVPMLSGPGAITSVMVLVNLYPRLEQKAAVLVAIAAIGLASYVTLLAAVPISHFIGDRGRLVFAKVMALILGAIGVQFVINGVKPLLIDILRAS
jgi:multiple antibiotic resistance protein